MTRQLFFPGSLALSLLPRIFRLVALSMVLVLLAVRLGSFTEELFVTPTEDAIFDVAFVSDEDKNSQAKSKVIKAHRSFVCELPSDVEMKSCPSSTITVATGELVSFPPDEVSFEIFIPPEPFC